MKISICYNCVIQLKMIIYVCFQCSPYSFDLWFTLGSFNYFGMQVLICSNWVLPYKFVIYSTFHLILILLIFFNNYKTICFQNIFICFDPKVFICFNFVIWLKLIVFFFIVVLILRIFYLILIHLFFLFFLNNFYFLFVFMHLCF